MSNIENAIGKLKPGDILPLVLDKCAKILLGNPNNIDITMFVISIVLKKDYHELMKNVKF